MKKVLLLSTIVLIVTSCSTNLEENKRTWKNEITAAEQAFAEMAQKDGIEKAFLAYAAHDAVLLRGNQLIVGKDALKKSFEANQNTSGTSLSWAPDFVDVAASGDLGYTYGKYVYQTTDSTGQISKSEGIFHTVWKRQPDGTWKFVWD